MSRYRALTKQEYKNINYSIVPIRDEDKYAIMQWRNEQIYHLRQDKPLTIERQEKYFAGVITQLFGQVEPNQILFSYLENNICIGYGGLVHINWIDKNAEISFIISTELEKDYFEFHWVNYLALIEKVAFEELKFHKLFTYAFDLRPRLYTALEKTGFRQEAILKEHILFDKKYIDVVIHAKFNPIINLRKATENDLLLYFNWANDEDVRIQSFSSNTIDLVTHTKWYEDKIQDERNHFYLFENSSNEAVGQVRIERQSNNKAVIGISIDKKFRGKGFAPKILRESLSEFTRICEDYTIEAYIKITNKGSINSFKKAGFNQVKELSHQGVNALLLTYQKDLNEDCKL